jgi:hypothetical protein
MGFDVPGIAKPKRKPAKKQRAGGVAGAEAGAALIGTPARKQLTKKKRRSILSTALGQASKAPAGGGNPAAPRKVAGPGTGSSGATRVVLNTIGATAEARVRDPLKQTRKDLTGARDAVKGIIGVPAAAYVVGKELATTGKTKTGKKLVRDVAKDYERRYGDAYRGKPGAYKKQLARQRAEGSFPEVLDLAAAAIPAGEGATVAVRALAKAEKAGGRTGTRAQRAIAATKKRAPLRESAGHVSPQKPRRTLTGAAVTTTTDKARKVVQARAKKRAASGKKKLTERRAAAQPGEVVAVSERLAAKRSRKRLAKTTRDERQVAAARIQRELTGRKGGQDAPADRTTRRNMQELPSDAHREAALYAHKYGIRDAAGAKAVLTRRVRQIEQERAKAPLTKGEALARDELPTLKALLADPAVFDSPAVRRVADVESKRATKLSGPETGLAPERHLLARYQPQADTLGIVRQAKDESTHAYARRVAKDLGLTPPTDAAAHALARERGISRQAATVEADRIFGAAVVKARAAHPNGPDAFARRTRDEPAEEFVARVREEAAKHGLAEPGYAPSRSNAAAAAQQQQGVSGNPEPAAGSFAKREGEVFRRGLERQDPEQFVGKLAQTVRAGTRLKAETDFLRREGKQFPDKAAANEWMEANHVDPKTVRLVNDPVVRKGDAPASGPDRGDYIPTATTYAMPEGLMKEWRAQHADPSVTELGAARAQSIQQAVLLGASPSWFTFQVLADSITLGASGGMHKLISANREYRKLSDEDRELVDIHIGGSPANDVLIDNSGKQLGRMAAVLATSPTYRTFVHGRRPLTALLRAEGARATAFRRAAFAARAAKLDKNIVGARLPLAKVQGALGKHADSPGDLARALANPEAAEAAAKHVSDIMGNFADYTALERRALKSVIPFYGFMRYSLRTVLYTLPVDHPYVATILTQLGRLSSDEAKDIVGPDLPYGLSKFYNADGTMAVDLSRASPVLNSLTASSAIGQLTSGLMPPVAVLVANQAFGKNLFTGRNYKVGGAASPTDGNDLTPEDRARIFGHELLKWIAPLRAYEKAALPPQTDDSLPFSRKPIQALDPKIANSLADSGAERDKQGAWDRFMHEMLPLFTPQQPTQDRAAGVSATDKKANRKALRTKREAKRDAIVNDPVEAAKFQQQQAKARVQEALPDQAYLDDLLEAAGLTP